MPSLWQQTCSIPHRDPLSGDTETEIAVIGAGLAGVLIADALRRTGRRVLVLEADRIGSGQTGRTTAKITSQHGLLYDKLIRALGRERAAQYARLNQQAAAAYADMIRSRGIACDYEEQDSFVYGTDRLALRSEAEAAASLGLPASYTEEIPRPIPAPAAVRFAGQAQFHPLSFLRAVAADLDIRERTRVQAVDGHTVITDRGRVRAEKIVFACHFPVVNFPGLYFVRMHQERSYVIALKRAEAPAGMWVDAEKGGYSLRTCGDTVLLGGGGHRTGQNRHGGRYDDLRQKAAAWFPGSVEAAHWSAQDCMTPDGAPYIGVYAPTRPDWFVATGFRKWGMTSSMAAALLLRDLVNGRSHPAAAAFDPGRFNVATAAGALAEMGHAAAGLGKSVFHIPFATADGLASGEAGIVRRDGRKAAVSRGDDGALHALSPRCTHLGCELTWNADEQTWDCPCHGSRFDAEGRLLTAPAQTPLQRW
ncbi:MAG: FAD-dependent oxidoreductase [Oscillospiraceae bacterium]|nr:FAD-dependent oxidoreductase [Oscillospiraceae bacterium]